MGHKLACKVSKSKGSNKITGKEAHNARLYDVDPKEKNINRQKSKLNEYSGAVGKQGALLEEVERTFEEINKGLRASGRRGVRKDANKVFELIVTSGGRFFKENDYKEFFEASDEALEAKFGKGCIAAKYIHLDEKTPHAHYMVYPFMELEDGTRTINYNKTIGDDDLLSDFQQHMYDFMTKEKGYEFDERTRRKDTIEKYKDNLDWSKTIDEKKDIVDLMDESVRADYAVKGLMAEDEEKRLTERIRGYREEVEELEEQLESTKESEQFFIDEATKNKNKYLALKKGVAKDVCNSKLSLCGEYIDGLERTGRGILEEEAKKFDKKHLTQSIEQEDLLEQAQKSMFDETDMDI